MPKAVVVTHQAAMNTIDEINRRYVDDGKIILFALSALNFDLSVYDILVLCLSAAPWYCPTRAMKKKLNSGCQHCINIK